MTTKKKKTTKRASKPKKKHTEPRVEDLSSGYVITYEEIAAALCEQQKCNDHTIAMAKSAEERLVDAGIAATKPKSLLQKIAGFFTK